jgi:hypothetical protein
LQKTQWADDSIRVEVKTAGLTDEPENAKVFDACHGELNEVKLRLMLGCYGPGTETKPKARYFWLLGESATIHCKDPDTADWFREQLFLWLKSLDGIRLVQIDGPSDDEVTEEMVIAATTAEKVPSV